MMAMKRILAAAFVTMLVLSVAGCSLFEPAPTPAASPTAAPTDAPTAPPEITPAATATPEPPTPSPTPSPTPVPSPTAEGPDSAGASVLFDIYQSSALVDINKDGTPEDITFTSGADKSTLEINGTAYDVPKPGLAQLFAVMDMDTSDKILELVFTDKYNANLADSEKAFSWMYWWNGSKLISMGGLMDVKFDGNWRSAFKAEDVTDGKGQVFCLTRTQELTDIWYVAYYKTTGNDRKLYEWRHTAEPVNELEPLTCKTVCLLQSNHDETSRDHNKYANSMYDYYWIPTLEPTTLGRIADPDEGIKLIARPDDKLTITGTYGPTWFKVKTQDGYVGWIYCKDKKVGAYNATVGWTAEDMFDGLVSAG